MANQIVNCEVCGFEGVYTGKEWDKASTIIMGEYRNPTGHTGYRFECKDVKGCIDRVEANSIRLTVLSQSQFVGMRG